LFPSPLA
jgi:hypothetical protein